MSPGARRSEARRPPLCHGAGILSRRVLAAACRSELQVGSARISVSVTPDRRRQYMGQRGRAKCAAEFNWDRIAAQTEAVYTS